MERLLIAGLLLGLSLQPSALNAQPSYDRTTSPIGEVALVGTSARKVIGHDASRQGIIFVNPSAKYSITVVPDNQVAVVGQGIVILPQGQWSFIGDGKSIKYNCGWNAIADGGADNPLEIIELR